MTLEQRKKLKEEGVIGSTMDALDGVASVVGSSVGLVGSRVASVAGTGVGLVGSGVTAGAGLVGSGVTIGAGIVGSGFGAVGSGLGDVGSGLSKAGKFIGRTITGQTVSRRSGSSIPTAEESGGVTK